MRILHLAPFYYPSSGGTQILTQKISEGLVSQGHQVRVLTSARSGSGGYLGFGSNLLTPLVELKQGVEIVRSFGADSSYRYGTWTETHLPKTKLREWLCWQFMKSVRYKFEQAILENIAEFKPEVIMNMIAWFSNAKMLLNAYKKKRFRFILTPVLHGEDTRSNMLHTKSIIQYADAVVAFTEYEADLLEFSFKVPRNKIFISGLGAELPARVQFQAQRQPWVLYLGRQTNTKGIDALIEVMELIWKTKPEARLIIAGANHMKKNWAELFRHETRDRVIIHNDISEEVKESLLFSSSCLVFPSKFESFGLVLLEAWAHWLPVVTWDIPVMRSIISEGIDGFRAKVDDQKEMAAKILFLLENPNIAQQMGEKGRKKVEEKYVWDKVVNVYSEAYRFVVGR